MSGAENLPLWAAVPVALLLLAGSFMTLAGSFGLLRLRFFYERLHAPTITTSMGIGCVLLASMIFFSVLETRLVLHEVLIFIFVVATTPVTLMLVARAAINRDRLEGNPEVPVSAKPMARPEQPSPEPVGFEKMDAEHSEAKYR